MTTTRPPEPPADRPARAASGDSLSEALAEEPEVDPVEADAAWLAFRAAEIWPSAATTQDRLTLTGGQRTADGAAVRTALRTALVLQALGSTVRATQSLWKAQDSAQP